MGKNENNIMCSIKNINNLYKEISAFFNALDVSLGNKNYESLIKNKGQVVGYTGKLLREPEYWLPTKFCRDYKQNSQNFIATEIILNELDEDIEIKQPLFIATKYKFVKGYREADEWGETSWYNYFNTIPSPKEFNKVYSKKEIFSLENKKRLNKVDEECWYDEEFNKVEELKFIVEPLFELKNQKLIKGKILNKLLS